MSLHPGTASYNAAGNSDFTRKAEALALALALSITGNWSTSKATDGAKGGPGQSYGSGGTPPLPAQAAQWPTPAAQNWKGSSEASVTRADGKNRMEKWREELEARNANVKTTDCSSGNALVFHSTHKHASSGLDFHVRHKVISLHWDPKDK